MLIRALLGKEAVSNRLGREGREKGAKRKGPTRVGRFEGGGSKDGQAEGAERKGPSPSG